MHKKRRLLLFCMLLCCTLPACDNKVSPRAVENGPFEVGSGEHVKKREPVAPVQKLRVVDYLGRDVQLDSPARRIVALSPHIVENLYSAGLGGRIVAAVDYADYPAGAAQIPRIGGYSNFSVESVVAYQPDLVVGWASGYKGFGQLLKRLEQLGIAVYADDPRLLTDITRSVKDLAVLGNTSVATSDVLASFSNRLRDLRRQYAVEGTAAVRLFYEIWPDPLQTLNGKHLVSAAIEMCAGQNIFYDAAALAPVVNIESVLKSNPELIIASSSNNQRPAWLAEWLRWPSILAVENQQIYFIPGDLLSRHSLRIAQGVELLCEYIDNARRLRDSARFDTGVQRTLNKTARVLER